MQNFKVSSKLIKRLVLEAVWVLGVGIGISVLGWVTGIPVLIAAIIGLSAMGIMGFLVHLGGILAVKETSTRSGSVHSFGLINDATKFGAGWRSTGWRSNKK